VFHLRPELREEGTEKEALIKKRKREFLIREKEDVQGGKARVIKNPVDANLPPCGGRRGAQTSKQHTQSTEYRGSVRGGGFLIRVEEGGRRGMWEEKGGNKEE